MVATKPQGSTNSLRFHHLMHHVPDLLSYKTCLYVGANRARHLLVPELAWAGYQIDVLEVFTTYIAQLHTLNEKRGWFRKITQGDVTKVPLAPDSYDLVLWWHGPEHVAKAELQPILDKLTGAAKHLAVVGAPHRKCGQGVTKDGNTHQRHQWDVMPDAFKPPWLCQTLDREPVGQHSHLIAWSRQ